MSCTEERLAKFRGLLAGDSKYSKLTDVTFEVTDVLSGAKRSFPSIRGVCALMSRVMEAMFFGHMAEAKAGCRVPIAGVRVEGFEWLLSYFYGLRPTLTVENVVSVLQSADRFIVTEVVNDCGAFIESKADEIDFMLPIAAAIESLKLQSVSCVQKCLECLSSKPEFIAAALNSANFRKAANSVVRATVACETLPITEEKLWLKLEQWAKHRADECKSEDAEDWRHFLSPFLPQIRFPVMDPTFFCQIAKCAILSDSQSLSVFMAHHSDADCEFPTTARRKPSPLPSEILTGDEASELCQKVAEECGVTLSSGSLLFRGSEHDFSAQKFHELCDGKGATLTVAHTEYGHVIGGFASKSWDLTKSYQSDDSSFLFVSRVNESKREHFSAVKMPAIFAATHGDDRHLRGYRSSGPQFGNGPHFYIADNCNQNQSSFYWCKRSFAHSDLSGDGTLDQWAVSGNPGSGTGKAHFGVVEYEVFSVAL